MFKSKTPAPIPTFEERLVAAHVTAEAAVSTFDLISLDLEDAAEAKDAIANDIELEIVSLLTRVDELHELHAEAIEFASQNRAKAAKIRALVSA